MPKNASCTCGRISQNSCRVCCKSCCQMGTGQFPRSVGGRQSGSCLRVRWRGNEGCSRWLRLIVAGVVTHHQFPHGRSSTWNSGAG